jgi:hypothetical protein
MKVFAGPAVDYVEILIHVISLSFLLRKGKLRRSVGTLSNLVHLQNWGHTPGPGIERV